MPPKWKSHSWLMPDPRNRGSYVGPHRRPPDRDAHFRAHWENGSLPHSRPAAVKVEQPKPVWKPSPLTPTDSAFGKDPTFPTVNLASTSKESTFPLFPKFDFGMPTVSFPSTQPFGIPAKRKSEELSLENIAKSAESASPVEATLEGNPFQGSSAADPTSVILSQPKNGETATLNNIESSSRVLQSKIRDAQVALDRLVAKKKDDRDGSNQDANGDEGSTSGRNISPREKDPPSIIEPQTKRKKRHIQIFENSLSIRRPGGMWKNWDDDEKINVARWFGAHPEDVTPETTAKWGMPEQEMWPFFAEGAWQMPSLHVEYRLRPVSLEVGEKIADTECEGTERFTDVFGSDETSAEGASVENGK